MGLDHSPELFSPQKEYDLLCSYVGTCDSQSVDSFNPMVIMCPNLVKVYKETLHTKYQSSTPSSFR